MPPASGTLYDPFGPRVADAPTKTMDAMETMAEKMMLGIAPLCAENNVDQ